MRKYKICEFGCGRATVSRILHKKEINASIYVVDNNLLTVNRSLIINSGSEVGSFGYWSSTEDVSNMVGRTYFGAGSTYGNFKNDLFRVRAIRAF